MWIIIKGKSECYLPALKGECSMETSCFTEGKTFQQKKKVVVKVMKEGRMF